MFHDEHIGVSIPDLSTFGRRLRYARELRKLKQKELAALAGIKQPSLSELETGETKEISGPVLIAIAKTLRVRPEWLMNRSGPMDQGETEALPVDHLTEQALEIARAFDQLPAERQDHVRRQIEFLRDTDERRRAVQHDVEIKQDALRRPKTRKVVR